MIQHIMNHPNPQALICHVMLLGMAGSAILTVLIAVGVGAYQEATSRPRPSRYSRRDYRR